MMPVTFSPIITDLGQGVFVPLATGIEFTFTHVAVGTGTSAVDSTVTALENEIARFPIAGGGINSGGKSASINALITNHTNANPQNYNISEIGFFGLDASSNTILFAIYRQGTTIINKVAGVDIAIPFSLGLGALPASNITVQLDTNISAMMALLGQHSSLSHPHTQYKRTLDNTERLKLADGVDNDEAVSKGQLDGAINTEADTRANADTALQTAINNEATARSNADTALQNSKADLAGSSTQTFSVATATANDHAVRKEQLDALSNAAITNEQVVKLVYPVGSLIEFQDGTDPNTLWPWTTWTVYGEGRVTVAQKAGDFPLLTAVGGGKEITLNMAHIPEHDHNRNADGHAEDVHISTGGGIAGDYYGGNGYIFTHTKTGKAGQATPTPVPTMPPYIVVKRWVRTA